jgi:hypothetical protein
MLAQQCGASVEIGKSFRFGLLLRAKSLRPRPGSSQPFMGGASTAFADLRSAGEPLALACGIFESKYHYLK